MKRQPITRTTRIVFAVVLILAGIVLVLIASSYSALGVLSQLASNLGLSAIVAGVISAFHDQALRQTQVGHWCPREPIRDTEPSRSLVPRLRIWPRHSHVRPGNLRPWSHPWSSAQRPVIGKESFISAEIAIVLARIRCAFATLLSLAACSPIPRPRMSPPCSCNKSRATWPPSRAQPAKAAGATTTPGRSMRRGWRRRCANCSSMRVRRRCPCPLSSLFFNREAA